MARAKRPSDELYNARRRAKRLAARLEREGKTAAASSLRETVAQSYGKGAKAGITELASAERAARPQGMQVEVPTTSVRPSRPKRASDEVYNERRRLRRQAARLEHEAQRETGTAKELAEGMARYLRQQAETGKKLTREQQQAEIQRLERIRKVSAGSDETRFRIKRRNAIFMQQLNAAGTEGAESAISDTKKSLFWAATKGLWPKGSNGPRNERYERILEHFYMENTTDAQEFRKWLKDEKGIDPSNAFGDLQLVYEYITEELNDPAQYDLPEIPYQSLMDLVRTAM